MGREFPETWTCAENADKAANSGDVPEKTSRIPEGKLDRALTSVEDAEKKKEQEMLLRQQQEQKQAKQREQSRPKSKGMDFDMGM